MRGSIWPHDDEALPVGLFAEALRDPNAAKKTANRATLSAFGRTIATQEDWDYLTTNR